MTTHHTETVAPRSYTDRTDLPWALSVHLLSLNHDQLLRVTTHPFLARAANGTLPKSVVATWLANDREYLQVYIGVIKHTLNIVRQYVQGTQTSGIEPSIETRLIAWLESAIQNGEREIKLFQEVADIYKIDLHPSPLHQNLKAEGLVRYETLFANLTAQQPNAFIPWLEGAVLLWATEKCYYKAWSWARRQDAMSSPRTFDHDQDGGAMRREFIPNWANREFLLFVEQLERILNEGVSEAVGRDDVKWREVKTRASAIWRAVLDAEEAFWPQLPGIGAEGGLKQGPVDGVHRDVHGSTLNTAEGEKGLRHGNDDIRMTNGHVPVVN